MKIDRLMGILTILLQRDQVTAPMLAQRFEVSRRTINRDLEDLCRAGIPIVTTQGYGGGISLAPEYQIDRALVTPEELRAMLAGLRSLDSIADTAYADTLREKLSRRGGAAEEESIRVELASYGREALVRKIAALRRAIDGRRVVAFTYYTEKGEHRRRVEPYRLVFRWYGWYLFGYCLARQDWRLFKLDRLWQLEETAAGFTPRALPPEDTGLAGPYQGAVPIRLRAVFAPEVRYRLLEEYGPESYEELPGGGLLFTWDFAKEDYLRAWIFSFGSKVRVLEPSSLQRERLAQAQEILQQT